MVRVRPACLDDRTFVLDAAERLSAFGPPSWRRGADIVEGEARTLRAFFESPEARSQLLIAESDAAEPLGFIFLEEGLDYFTLEPHGHIGILAVVHAAEGTGAGTALVRAAERWARERGYPTLTLNVFEGNRHARDVYEHLGFRIDTIKYLKTL
jgi:GNAT superfamily N-acetyltransferase